MIDVAIRAILTAHPNIVAIVGDRIRPTQSGQDDDKPRITYSSDDGDPLDCLDEPATHGNIAFQVDVVGRTVTEARDLVQRVFRAMHFYSGTAGGVKVEIIRWTGTTDLTPPARDGEEKPDPHFAMSFNSLIEF